MVPLPLVLKLSEGGGALFLELPYIKGISINSILKDLAGKFPGFKFILEDKSDNKIANIMIFVNGKFISAKQQRAKLLKDDSEIKFMAPYTGG